MAQASIASVVVPHGGLGHEVRAALVVWQRELIRFRRDPTRVLSSIVQPLKRTSSSVECRKLR